MKRFVALLALAAFTFGVACSDKTACDAARAKHRKLPASCAHQR